LKNEIAEELSDLDFKERPGFVKRESLQAFAEYNDMGETDQERNSLATQPKIAQENANVVR
jgi:ethanolamine ammonia-lyase small subunit